MLEAVHDFSMIQLLGGSSLSIRAEPFGRVGVKLLNLPYQLRVGLN